MESLSDTSVYGNSGNIHNIPKYTGNSATRILAMGIRRWICSRDKGNLMDILYMVEEVVLLATEKGFKAKTLSTMWVQRCITNHDKGLRNDMTDYLILCEIQQWLRTQFRIDITIMIRGESSYEYSLHLQRYGRTPGQFPVVIDATPKNHKDVYADCLGQAVYEGLKLI